MKRLALILGIFTLLLVSLSNAQQRWERNYGGTASDIGRSVQQTTDGGYIVAGWTTSFGNGEQVYLIKTNASGDTLWTRSYGGTGTDYGFSVQQTQDGGYIVAGSTLSFGNALQVYLIKTNASGDTLWTRNYGEAGTDDGAFVRQTSDNGYIIIGSTTSFGNGWQVYLIKTNVSGDTLWTRTYGGAGTYDLGYSGQQTTDGGYIIGGVSNSFGNSRQVYLIKTDASGDTIWTRTYGEAGDDWGFSVQQTQDEGYIVAGEIFSLGGFHVYLVKTNSLGDTLWTRVFGGGKGWSVQQTSELGYIIAGSTGAFGNSSQVYLIKTNASGDTLWTRNYGGAGDDVGYSVQQTTDGGYIVAGETYSFGNNDQVYLIKTDANGNVGVEESRQGDPGLKTAGAGKVTPNPFTSFATLPGHEAERFSLYDISGRKVGVYKGDRIGEGLAPGVYFLRSSDSKDKPLRIVKVR